MNEIPESETREASMDNFLERLSYAKKKKGVVALTDEDMLLLMADALSATITYEEKGYR
jgi:hypothetical protein